MESRPAGEGGEKKGRGGEEDPVPIRVRKGLSFGVEREGFGDASGTRRVDGTCVLLDVSLHSSARHRWRCRA